MPTWVKVFVIVGALLVAGFVVSLLAGVEHGPGMHGPEGPVDHSPPVEHGP